MSLLNCDLLSLSNRNPQKPENMRILIWGSKDFSDSLTFERSACFYVSVTENFEHLQQISWKWKTFFKKLEYHILVESSKIDNATYPHKTSLLEVNIKTNRTGRTKWPYDEEQFCE